MRRMFGAMFVLLLVAGMLSACGGREEQKEAAPVSTETVTKETTEEPTAEVPPVKINVNGKDYAFDIPATIRGGLVEFTFNNIGREPHSAAFAKVAQGKTIEDVKAALTAPPSGGPPPGPPPFEHIVSFPTADPGVRNRIAFNLPVGSYALYCTIPSPDGIPHGVKGMISEVTVTEGTPGNLPASVETVTATDFALNPLPTLRAGSNVVRLRNEGKQLHEINLVELGPGKKVEDIVAWNRQPVGPPPVRYLGGVAVKPGEEATTELELKAGPTYTFVCEIPDFLGDFQSHVTKGMYTQAFTVS